MKGKSFKTFGMNIFKRVTSAVLVAVMLFTMVGIYIPAETFKAASKEYTIYFRAENGWTNVNAYIWKDGGATMNGTWPGSAMTKEGDDWVWQGNWNDAENLNIIFNNGSSQTGDLSLSKTQLQASTEWRYYSSGSWEQVGGEEIQPVPKDIKIRFKNTKNWSSVHAYIWDSDNNYPNDGWPGKAITKEGDYYVWTYSGWDTNEPINIIFNNGNGGGENQTTNLSLTSDDFAIATDWIFTPNSSKDGDGKWMCDKADASILDTAIYEYTLYVSDFVEDKWDADEDNLYVWYTDKDGKEVSKFVEFEESDLTLNGGKWIVAKFEATANFKYILREKTNWIYQTSDLTHSNNTKTNEILYYVDETIYTDEENVPDLSTDGNYVFVEYAGDMSIGTNVYSWANGYSESGFFVPFRKTEDGSYIAKIPVKLDGNNDRKLGFLINSLPDKWEDQGAQKYSDDLFYTLDAEKGYGKILFSGGSIVKDLTDVKSSVVHRMDGNITFTYRDNVVFAENGIGYLGEDADVKVHVIEKTDTAQSEVATYDMTYDKSASAYIYNLELNDDTDYYYYYTVNGVEAADTNTTRKAELSGKTYSYNRNKVYNVAVDAEVYYDSMDYNDNNVISINYGPKTDKDSLDGFKLEHVYLDLTELGLGNKVEVNKELMEFSFGCSDTVAAGEKTIKVTLVDDCDMEYYGEVKVNVTKRDKTDDFDWDEAVIYFAVTDRFYDGNASNNTVTDDGEAITAYDKSNPLGLHGGDFAGLTEKLDYLEELGVNTIWITPIVDNIDEAVDGDNESYAYHGYWSEDFTTLNPHLGTPDEFKALIDGAHERGMKIMVDVVLNHGGYETEEIFNSKLDTGYVNGEGEPVYDDMIRENSEEGDDEKMSLSGLPDFMTEDPEVRALLIAWQTQWMQSVEKGGFDIDYYRVDTVKHVDDTTWAAFKNALTKIDPTFKMIGEYYDAGCMNDYDQLGTGMMDSVLDFHFNDIISAVASEDLLYIEDALQNRNALLNNAATMGSFLSSHDENGFMYDLVKTHGESEDWATALMKVAATYQITAKGQPVIYYGEEIGLTGANNYPNQDNRYDFDWTLANADNPMYAHYKKMLNIRKEYSEIFAKGDRYSVVTPNVQSDRNGTQEKRGYEVFARSYNGETIYVGTNVWGDAKEVTFYVNGGAGSTYTNLYDGKTYTVSSEGSIKVSIPGAASGGTVVLVKTAGAANEIEDDNKVTVVIHYNRPDGKYDNWNAWLWADGLSGAQYDFEKVNGEMITSVTVDGRTTTNLKYRIRYGEWKGNDPDDKDQMIDISEIVSGTVHYYIESGKWGGTTILGSDAIIGNKVVSSSYDRVTKQFTITTARPISGTLQDAFEIKCTTSNTDITITDVTANGCTHTVTVKEDLSSMEEVLKAYTVKFDGYVYNLVMPNIYSTDEFESLYTYNGDDLGLTYTDSKSTFKVWAPTAKNMSLNIYESGTKGTDDLVESYEMELGEYGVWSYELDGKWEGYYYTYTVDVNNKVSEVCDPYARTTGVNGNRAMILDLDDTDPEGWAEDADKNVHEGMSYTDAIIYELHVRDLSSDPSSGIENKGKFLGLTETGTTTSEGTPTGLDHIVDLGVTHVHLLPVYDYASVDESKLDETKYDPQFNWGYDPLNYNVPEGSYSTNPYDGASRVSEMKQMVKALHDNNINVIMDVVYNHVYDAGTFGFNQLVPNYFSRTNADGSLSNGSGCGNDTASERNMVHKYIVESILYWHEEYHIDGFRFDLVGLLDTDTINEIVESVHAIDEDIIFYGEGWTLGTATSKPVEMATQANADKTPGFAYFSDTIRNGLTGNNELDGQGVLWITGKEESMAQWFTANTGWCPDPSQSINYASCHDNYTLMDKINGVTKAPYDSYDDAPGAYQVKLNNLAASFYMLSQGIPFIHAGEEFLRTKLDTDGTVIHNSYNSSDYVNTIRWYNLDGDALYADTVEYYKGLIEFRKNHEALRLTTSEEVAENVTYHWISNEVVLFEIDAANVDGEVADSIVIIYNMSGSDKQVSLDSYGVDSEAWKVCIDVNDASAEALRTVSGNVTVAAKSCMALVQGETIDTDSVYLDNNNVTISVDKTLELQEGKTSKLTATVTPANSTLTWASSNTSVATVDNDGKVTAVGVGTATITVSTVHGETATCTVTVVEKQSVSLDKTTLTLKEDATDTLTATATPAGTTVTWTSSNTSVATVDANGKVTAVGVGTATITATTPDGATASCSVTVTEKDKVVHVPETEVKDQLESDAEDLVDKITGDESVDGVVSEETLDNVKDAIDDGQTIITELVIENVKVAEVLQATQELVEEALENIKEDVESVIAQYLDIKVVLKAEETDEELGTLNKLSEEITLTFTIPDEWKKEGRVFNVIRVHEGEADILDVWENEDGSLSFKTDRFSTYALVYTDVVQEDESGNGGTDTTPNNPTQPNQPSTPDNPTQPTPPETGDTNKGSVYVLILLAGFAVAMAGVANLRRKYVK